MFDNDLGSYQSFRIARQNFQLTLNIGAKNRQNFTIKESASKYIIYPYEEMKRKVDIRMDTAESMWSSCILISVVQVGCVCA